LADLRAILRLSQDDQPPSATRRNPEALGVLRAAFFSRAGQAHLGACEKVRTTSFSRRRMRESIPISLSPGGKDHSKRREEASCWPPGKSWHIATVSSMEQKKTSSSFNRLKLHFHYYIESGLYNGGVIEVVSLPLSCVVAAFCSLWSLSGRRPVHICYKS